MRQVKVIVIQLLNYITIDNKIIMYTKPVVLVGCKMY